MTEQFFEGPILGSVRPLSCARSRQSKQRSGSAESRPSWAPTQRSAGNTSAVPKRRRGPDGGPISTAARQCGE
jgi:hypothetical protein